MLVLMLLLLLLICFCLVRCVKNAAKSTKTGESLEDKPSDTRRKQFAEQSLGAQGPSLFVGAGSSGPGGLGIQTQTNPDGDRGRVDSRAQMLDVGPGSSVVGGSDLKASVIGE